MKHVITLFSLICMFGFAVFLSGYEAVAQDASEEAEIAVETVATEASLIEGMAKPWQLGFQEPATPVMTKLYNLHDELLIIITVITIFVLGLLWYVCVRFSAKNNKVPSKTTHNNLLEVIWTLVPLCILGYIFAKSLPVHYYMDEAQEPDMTLKVTGYQWYWGYEYPEYDNLEFKAYIKKDEDLGPNDMRLLSTDKPVVVPVGKTVRLIGTGADVIHNWAMPSFGVKMDVVPGRLNEMWFKVEKPGIYYGQCSELCGVNHGFMPIEVRAVEQDVFDAWIKRAQDSEEYTLAGLALPPKTIVAPEVEAEAEAEAEVEADVAPASDENETGASAQ